MSDDIIFDLYKYDPDEQPPTVVYKAIKEIKYLRQQLASRNAEVAELTKQNLALQKAIDFDLLQAQQETIDQLREQVTLLRQSLLSSANYIDKLGGNSFDPRRTLAATEPKS